VPAGDAVELHLHGDIDLLVEPELIETILHHTGRAIVIDMARVDFIDSCGLRARVIAHRSSVDNEAGFTLRAVPEPVMRVLKATELDGVLPIAD
jgi:anti-anti-sigma factor